MRQDGPDGLEEVLTDVAYPVTIGFDTEGALHVAYPAFAPNAGAELGALLRIDPAAETPTSLAGLEELPSTCEGGPGPAGDDMAGTTPATATADG